MTPRARAAARGAPGRGGAAAAAALAIAAAAALGCAAGAHAAPGLDAVRVSGLLDLTAKLNRERVAVNIDNDGESTYSALALRLNLDFQVSEKTTVLTEVFAPGGFRFGLYGAFVRFRDVAGTSVSMQIGKIPSFFGGYSSHAYGRARPLMSYPLIYQYHTVLASDAVPRSAAALLAWKEDRLADPQFGQVTGALGRKPLPLHYDRCWDTGIELFTSTDRLEVSAGVTTGTLSNPLDDDENSGKQVVGRVAFLIGAGTRFGVSAAYGPYLDVCETCLEGDGMVDSSTTRLDRAAFDAADEISLGADLEWGMRHFQLYAEAMHKRWESPWIREDLLANGYHTELKYTIVPGLYAALAYGEILFNAIERADGVEAQWDYSIRRVESGLGYLFDPRTLLRLSVQWNELYGVDAGDVEGALPAVQLEVGF